ncbi:hypothetical protein J5N97_010549 [Dioscorea zingiberensis]|uniref:Heat shock protein 70 n=1 Tax=Dioscorea zingiberensis TaxID=325984 RepID=A0A9D5HMN1_9LILI|nr:hypothetical protein J5N97_010549 [Dioscorea zingiberensis]
MDPSSPTRTTMAEYHYTVASDSETSVEDKQQSSLDIAIGIDIGTSHCRIAVWNHGLVELVKDMPSYVLLKDDSPESTIQNVAYNEEEILSGSAIFNLKRLIGRMDTDPVVHASKTLPFLVQTLDIGGRPFIATLENNVWRSRTPEELLASLFWKLKGILEVHLMCSIRNVVLTVPVSFNRIQLTRIERACAMAGLYILRLMPEPTAVALLYAQQLKQLSSHENIGNVGEKKALIFNMGAGYCDVAVIAVDQGISQIMAFSGSTLGGEDILQNVLHLLVPNFDSFFSSRSVDKIRALGILRIATQDAIDRLSSQTSVPIDVDIGDGTKILRDLDRSEFEENSFPTPPRQLCVAFGRIGRDLRVLAAMRLGEVMPVV